jgi:cytidylate kinase
VSPAAPVDPASRAVVAIDGPSGSGKSSVAKGTAKALGLAYLDTGAMYRAMTWWMLQQGVPVGDPEAVAARAGEPSITSTTDPDAPGIAADGTDVGEAIRGPEVTAAVSAVSAVPAVRSRLVALQRGEVARAAEQGTGIVVEGRDIGSVVLPDADLKVYLTADARVRAQRRAAQDAGMAHGSAGAEATHEELLRRDAQDSGRAASPLQMANGAVEVDATDLDLQQTIAAVVGLVRQRVGSA